MSLLSDSAPIGLLPRRLAWDVLQAVAAGAYADVALERVLRKDVAYITVVQNDQVGALRLA